MSAGFQAFEKILPLQFDSTDYIFVKKGNQPLIFFFKNSNHERKFYHQKVSQNFLQNRLGIFRG